MRLESGTETLVKIPEPTVIRILGYLSSGTEISWNSAQYLLPQPIRDGNAIAALNAIAKVYGLSVTPEEEALKTASLISHELNEHPEPTPTLEELIETHCMPRFRSSVLQHFARPLPFYTGCDQFGQRLAAWQKPGETSKQTSIRLCEVVAKKMREMMHTQQMLYHMTSGVRATQDTVREITVRSEYESLCNSLQMSPSCADDHEGISRRVNPEGSYGEWDSKNDRGCVVIEPRLDAQVTSIYRETIGSDGRFADPSRLLPVVHELLAGKLGALLEVQDLTLLTAETVLESIDLVTRDGLNMWPMSPADQLVHLLTAQQWAESWMRTQRAAAWSLKAAESHVMQQEAQEEMKEVERRRGMLIEYAVQRLQVDPDLLENALPNNRPDLALWFTKNSKPLSEGLIPDVTPAR